MNPCVKELYSLFHTGGLYLKLTAGILEEPGQPTSALPFVERGGPPRYDRKPRSRIFFTDCGNFSESWGLYFGDSYTTSYEILAISAADGNGLSCVQGISIRLCHIAQIDQIIPRKTTVLFL